MIEQPIPAHVRQERVFDFDVYNDSRLIPDVHVGYLRVFAEAPRIFWTPRNGGHWVVMGKDALTDMLKDPAQFSSRQLQIPADEHAPQFIPAALDPPDHAMYRRVIVAHFMPNSINKLADHIRSMARELIERVLPRGKCEFIKDISEPLPISIFMRMMGMPLERFDEFRAIAVGILTTHDTNVRVAYFHQVIAEFDALVAARRMQPADDVISKVVSARVDDELLSEDRVRSLCLNLFLGGLDTVTNAMTFMARHLANDPALQQALSANLTRVPDAVDEGLRRYGFVNTVRRATRDLVYRGVTMCAGDMIFCVLPTVGLDEAANNDPQRFDIDRPRRNHFVFSHGEHTCLGLHLARLELRILFEEWQRRVPAFKIAPTASLQTHSGVVMGLDALPLQWAPPTAVA
jgi:cytochrome P450